MNESAGAHQSAGRGPTQGQDIAPLEPNPGGIVDPADLVGRDAEVERLTRSITTGGAVVLGDRRMGKTSLLRKVEQVLSDVGHVVIRVSAETSDPKKFGDMLTDALLGHARLGDRRARWKKELGGEVRVNAGVAGLALSAKATSPDGPKAREISQRDLFRDIAHAADPYRVVLILDEVTVLAMAIGRTNPDGAAEFLRSLRQVRQDVERVAMIFAGSIGLHHVVRDRTPVNDLDDVDVGPLATDDAVLLARRLLRGVNADLAEPAEVEVAQALVTETNGVPYYLNLLVEALYVRGKTYGGALTELVDGLLADPDDPLDMAHYATRLDDYYGSEATLVRAMLDAYAMASGALTVEALEGVLAAVDLDPRPDRDALLSLIRKLEADHYLVRAGQRDTFSPGLLRRYWIARRRLG